MIKRLLLTLFCMLIISACAATPQDAADAEAKRLQAQQDAADQAARRQRDQQLYAIQEQERQTLSQAWVEAQKVLIARLVEIASWSVGLILAGLALGASIALVGLGLALSQAAMLRASLIPADRETGLYPLLQYHGHGLLSLVDPRNGSTLTNPNTGQAWLLDTRNPADRQMVAGMVAVQLSGVVSRNASKHKTDPAGVSLVGTRPVVIGEDGSDAN